MNNYTFEDMQVGLEASFQIEVTEGMMEAFLAMSGDCNPLHVDESFAVERGFPGRVVYGMLTSSFYSTLVGVYLPGKCCLLQSIEVKMSVPVFVGDMLTVSGVVAEIHESTRMVRVKAHIHNAAGKRVSRAVIQVGFTS